MTQSSKIIKGKTAGYSHKYASLKDLVEQGVDIPKTRIKLIDGIEYLEYYDKELNEWELGARVVIPQDQKRSASQNYGAGLSYARRYTTYMSQCVATDDEKAIEESDNKNQKEPKEPLATAQQVEIITKNNKWLIDELKNLGIKSESGVKKLTLRQASELCRLVKERRG